LNKGDLFSSLLGSKATLVPSTNSIHELNSRAKLRQSVLDRKDVPTVATITGEGPGSPPSIGGRLWTVQVTLKIDTRHTPCSFGRGGGPVCKRRSCDRTIEMSLITNTTAFGVPPDMRSQDSFTLDSAGGTPDASAASK
jgi:hypothetical protein